MNEGFYRAFEDKYRGSRELILGRLNAYLPLIRTLKLVFPDARAVDLGCGRGEWLELLDSSGIEATGVDLDEGMLVACRDRGYEVLREDAIGCLSRIPSESLSLVSAFHLVEHISFEALGTLISEALRVLKPGGILVMETPNPENLCVGSESFYLDPSHVRPLPPRLLAFLPEYVGFSRTAVVRLQEPMGLICKEEVTLLDVLAGVSPDYAVIAQKAADPQLMEKFDGVFSTAVGLTLDKLAQDFEMRLLGYQARLTKVEAEYSQKIDEYTNELLSLYSSTSWRITRPLRNTVDFFRSHGISKQGWSPRIVLRKLISLLDHVPLLRRSVSFLLMPFPSVRIRLMQMRKEAQRGGSGLDSKRKKAISYNLVDLGSASDAPVDQIIERINAELRSLK